jgi:succinyl-diaminopimelate desuccinylase
VLFGRGAVDMKGAVAAFATAAMDTAAHGGPARGTLSLLITGDEEGAAVNGTRQVLAWAKARGIRFDAALIGEPTSRRRIGDTYKTGRRGSLSATLTVTGRQGHAAYPHLADNPIPRMVRILDRLAGLRLDEGSADFDPSTLALTSVDVGNPAFNVIPGAATARLNVRFNDRWTPGTLEARLREEIAAAGRGAADLAIAPGVSDCFLTAPGPLTTLLAAAIATVTGVTAEPSTGGGTSDARFFKDACPVVELGLIGATMHQADERVPLADLAALTAVYAEFIRLYFAAGA